MNENKKLVSIVLPCYNEEKNIDRTFDELLEMIDGHKYDFEIIAVNDGSKDNTWAVIDKYARKYEVIKGINFMRNYGQRAAYQALFDESKGDYIVTINADREQPLHYVMKVIEKLDEGFDFVNTNRAGRWGSGSSRKVKSGAANKIIAKISGVTVKDRGSGLKGFTRKIIDEMRLYGDMHRFMPDYASVYTKNITEFDVEFIDRDYGKSAYIGAKRTIAVLLDLLTLSFMLHFAHKPFYMMPGRLFGFTGAVFTGMGGLIGIYLSVLKFGYGESIGSRPLFTVGVLLIIIGIQSMMTGMLGELMLRTYFESSGRKTYTVREIVE